MRGMERDEVRRDEVNHDARAEHENFMPEVIAAEEFGACEFICDVKPDGEVGKGGKARDGVRDARLDHERDKAERAACDF